MPAPACYTSPFTRHRAVAAFEVRHCPLDRLRIEVRSATLVLRLKAPVSIDARIIRSRRRLMHAWPRCASTPHQSLCPALQTPGVMLFLRVHVAVPNRPIPGACLQRCVWLFHWLGSQHLSRHIAGICLHLAAARAIRTCGQHWRSRSAQWPSVVILRRILNVPLQSDFTLRGLSL